MANKKATRESYGEALAFLADENKDIVVLDADLSKSTKTELFQKKAPERFFDCGIAEGNMIGIAAGLAAAGKIPFASSFQRSISTFNRSLIVSTVISRPSMLMSSGFGS